MNRDQMIDMRFKQWELQRHDTYSPFKRRVIEDHQAATAVNHEVYLDTKPLELVDPGTIRPIHPPAA